MKHAELIAQMTLDEKCALLSGADIWHTRAISRLNIPSIALMNGSGGLCKQSSSFLSPSTPDPATCMPSPSTLANSWNPFAVQAVGSALGQEAAAQDVQVLLCPNANIRRSPLYGKNSECFSEDPYLSGMMAAAFIRGIQSSGVSACVGQFAASNQEHNQMAIDSVLDERTLRELYLTNFEIAVKEGAPQALMTGCGRVNGIPISENRHLLHDILRKEWQYDGAILSHWNNGDFVESVRAGCTLGMPSDGSVQLKKAVQSGKIEERLINERTDELLNLILTTSRVRGLATCDFEHDNQIAQRAAEESIVLLKNERDILPLAKSTKVAVIGDFAKNPRYQKAGRYRVNASMEDKTLELLPEYFRHAIGYAQGFRRTGEPDEKLAAQAETLAAQAETVILYLGLPEGCEAEGLERSNLHLPQNQIALLRRLRQINSRIIVVLSSGGVVEMPWLDQCAALLWAGLGGQAIAAAVLRVLVGDVNPSGKLADTFPLSYDKMPVSPDYPAAERTSEYREGLYVGYRFTETANLPVLFPFGFGLSYTTFSYSHLHLSETRVEFDLTNTGKCAGAEIVQLYVSLPNAKIFRPKLELKGFSKLFLRPDETRHVVIPLDEKAFRYFNVKTHRWEIEEGDYQLHIASNVRDIRLTGTLHLKGTDAPNPYAGKELSCYTSCKISPVPDAQFSALIDRPIPPHLWDTAAPLTLDDSVMQLRYAKNPLARQFYRSLSKKIHDGISAGHPRLNALLISNLSFRGIVNLTGGKISTDMAQTIVEIVNGQGLRGLGDLIKGLFSRPKLKI